MKETAVFTHKTCALHDTGPGHPEQMKRLEVVLTALKKPEFKALDWQDAPKATVAQLEYAHDKDYVQKALKAAPKEGCLPLDGYLPLDDDTIISKHSIEAALHAAGAGIAAVDHVIDGKSRTAFCAVRPPGHHAEKNRAMGFCVFANASIAALHAVKARGLKKVAIVDFDVHHGNGTQDIVKDHPEILFASTHQFPFYPGTGAPSETGQYNNIINAPLPAGSGSAEFRKAFSEKILPRLDSFEPELIVISAGFDAHKDDPLGQVNLTEADYVWVTEELKKIAAKHGQGRIVSMMEGGYNLTSLASSAAAHIGCLMKGADPALNSKPSRKPPSV